MKKIIIIISIVAILAVGAGVYLAWQKYSKSNEQVSVPATPSTANPSVNYHFSSSTASRMRQISKEPAWFYWLSKGAVSISGSSSASVGLTPSAPSSLFYIAASDHKIREIAASGETMISDSLSADDYQSAVVSFDGNLLALKVGNHLSNGLTGQWIIFDAKKKVQLAFLSNVSAFAWSPSDNKAIYFQPNNKGGSDLIINDFTAVKQKPQKIISLNQGDFSLQWIAGNNVLLLSPPSFDWESEIWNLDIKNKTLKKVAAGKSLTINWAKNVQEGLKLAQLGSDNYELSLVNFSGEKQADFKFKTFPDKCFIATASQLYCAISKNQEVFSLTDIFDRYLKREIYFKDGIYKVDLAENKFIPLYEGENPAIDAANLTFDGRNKLYFINRYDKQLYELEI